jgi:iron-sulfur cluster repair protein YtfE (RIC family)
VHAVHGARDPETLNRTVEVFGALREEMEMHMHKEGMSLFPSIEQYGWAEAQSRPMPPVPFGTIVNPIAMMEREHVSAGGAGRDPCADKQLRTAGVCLQYGSCSLRWTAGPRS